jgi:hypothetical protein
MDFRLDPVHGKGHQAHPDFRQAQTLLDAAESEVIKDGLVGVGAGAAVLGAVIGIVAAVARKR